MTATSLRTMRLGAQRYPLVLPNMRDPRLHLAAVIISVHVLGQTVLGFRVSVPQILSAILTCAIFEVVWTFVRTRQVVWPASAMLTGSGVALILRLVGMERGQHWSWRGWYLFALVAGASLVSKYVIRYRGAHIFNPSNLGLVVAFLVLGSGVIEPLDFWWAPLSPRLVAAYLIIVTGGLIITARLKLLPLASVFWLSLALGLGLLSASGHCITAAWAIGPVCGAEFWSAVMFSPELLIFLFFMITDPKTIPGTSAPRIAFAVLLGLACTLLMASQSTEFGAKVGLLGGLVLLTPLRFMIDRVLARPENEGVMVRLLGGRSQSFRPAFLNGASLGAALVLLAAGIVAAGAPARDLTTAASSTPAPIEVEIDAASLPSVTVSPEVAALNSGVASDPGALAIGLARALAVEKEAMLRADTSLLRSVADGQRLVTMERKVEAAAALGSFIVDEYTFESLRLDVVYTDGPQGGAQLALAASGSIAQVHYDPGGLVLDRTEHPFDTVFILSPGTGDRWLLSAEIDPA